MTEETKIISTVDVVLLTLVNGELCVLLQRRDHPPFEKVLALVGGYIQTTDSDSKATAERVLKQKTGIVSPYLEQLCTFANAGRDPRGWSSSVVYYALINAAEVAKQGKNYELVPVEGLPQLGFDHNLIVETARQRLRSKSMYSTLPCYLLPPTFTLGELIKTYIAVAGYFDATSFRRKIDKWTFIEKLPSEEMRSDGGKPAFLYRIKEGADLQVFNRELRQR